MSGHIDLAALFDRQRQIVDQLKPLIDRTAKPQFDMSDEEFVLIAFLTRDLKSVNDKIFAAGGATARPGPITEQ